MIQQNVAPATEEWRPVPGYEGSYQASDLGNIRRSVRAKRYPANYLLKTIPQRLGYHKICLCSKGKKRWFWVHQVIAATFIGERPLNKEINHKNLIRRDNRVCNLEYVTRLENYHHAVLHGKDPRPFAKLTEDIVSEIRREVAQGVSKKTLAEKHGVVIRTINQIVSRETWPAIP